MNIMPFLPALLAALCAVAAMFVAHQFNRKQQQQRQREGLDLLLQLCELLGELQRHRGLTNTWHNGDQKLAGDIRKLQFRVQSLQRTLAEKLEQHNGNRWVGISDHWDTLSTNYQTLQQEACLKQHNRLIGNLLYLIEDTADRHDLHRLGEEMSHISLVWRELLVTAEYIGQARALGAGVAASGHCSSVSRIRLNYLRQKIEQTTGPTWSHLSVTDELKRKLGLLLQTIEEKILSTQPGISAQDYFSLASDTLDDVFRQFQAEIQSLRLKL